MIRYEKDTRDHAWQLTVMFPVWVWWMPKVYDISNDVFRCGWFKYLLRISVGKFGYGVRIAHDLRVSLQPVPWFTAELPNR